MSSSPKEAAEEKGLFQSKTIWGIVLVILAAKAKDWFGLDLNETLGFAHGQDTTMGVAALWAAFGRFKAGKKIGKIF